MSKFGKEYKKWHKKNDGQYSSAEEYHKALIKHFKKWNNDSNSNAFKLLTGGIRLADNETTLHLTIPKEVADELDKSFDEYKDFLQKFYHDYEAFDYFDTIINEYNNEREDINYEDLIMSDFLHQHFEVCAFYLLGKGLGINLVEVKESIDFNSEFEKAFEKYIEPHADDLDLHKVKQHFSEWHSPEYINKKYGE